MIHIRVRNFPNLDESWRKCNVCGGTVDSDNNTTIGGRMFPEKEMIKYQGVWYCRKHFNWKFQREFWVKAPLHIPREDT